MCLLANEPPSFKLRQQYQAFFIGFLALHFFLFSFFVFRKKYLWTSTCLGRPRPRICPSSCCARCASCLLSFATLLVTSTRVLEVIEVAMILWMDKNLHHFETMGNHCVLVFTGESSFQGFLSGAGFCLSTVGRITRPLKGILCCLSQTASSCMCVCVCD